MCSRGGSLLPSIYADARYIAAVIVSQAVVGPNVTFKDLPYPLCAPPKADPTYFFTVYAGAQMILPNGTHLVTGMYTGCPPPHYVRNGGIHLFRSDDGQ